MNLQIRPPDMDETTIDISFFAKDGFIDIICHCCYDDHKVGCFGGDEGLQFYKLHPDCKLPRDKKGFLQTSHLGQD